jgi:hypothetical protein
MVTRGINRREAVDPAAKTEERPSPGKPPETGPFLLQVDRQTKASYATAETAAAAGMAIKTSHPHVQVSIYDSIECRSTVVGLPAAAQ